MKNTFRIAIFSGEIPSTTFVEYLIENVAKHHKIFVFGIKNKPKNYKSKNIRVHDTSRHFILNVLKTFWHIFLLFFTHPKRLAVVFAELKKYHKAYTKWQLLTRFIPIVRFLPDVLHIQWAKDLESYMFFKTNLGVKLVLSLRGAHINYSPIADLKLAESYKTHFPNVDAFHAVSKAIALEAEKYGASPCKIKLIHSPMPKTTLSLFETYKKSQTPLKVLSIGRFHWKKGYKYALDAFSILQSMPFQFEYTIISSNDVSEEILFQTHQLALVSQLNILQGLTQNELFKKLKDYDVLLLPSLEEGIANVVLEAMAVGLPVISTSCGGMAEVVMPNETGWLVPVRNPEALAKAMIKVSKAPEEELQRITQNAHEFVKYEFDTENGLQAFLELYEKVLIEND